MADKSERELTLATLTEQGEQAGERAIGAAIDPVGNLELARQRRTAERQEEAVALRMAGFSHAEIGRQLGVGRHVAEKILNEALTRPSRAKIERMQELENRRLDAAQAAIWPAVLAGYLKAGELFLKYSQRRARMNGLDEATKVNFTIGIRQEMEAALAELQNVVLGEVISSVDDTR